MTLIKTVKNAQHSVVIKLILLSVIMLGVFMPGGVGPVTVSSPQHSA
jgi:hypothetical protein